jgi:hypothetical protein
LSTDEFMSTPLWQRTLAPVDGDDHADKRGYLRTAFLRLRESMAVLLGELSASMPTYTVHDLTHADALWETASLVTGPDVELNPAEGFVLGAAFLFHDAATGLAAYPDGPAAHLGEDRWRDLVCTTFRNRVGRWPLDREMDEPPEDVVTMATQAAIRECHARHASTLVREPFPVSRADRLYLLDDARLRSWYGRVIGLLAESHWWDVDLLGDRFRHVAHSPTWLPGWTVDPLLLACVTTR